MRGHVEASSASGDAGYSTNEGQIGQGNIGRTAAAWLGYRLIGEGKSRWHESLSMVSNSDVSLAEVWTTRAGCSPRTWNKMPTPTSTPVLH